ncbi:Myb-related protein Myb4-like [Canna indica]|uniref:Myb-related protein Myb4-like n=1 Tax=Canna indica TaxID=4628 RepID=A0AAQ3JTS7_9LILI|nr:Myb-related protein Myb4-like [Canna indica]
MARKQREKTSSTNGGRRKLMRKLPASSLISPTPFPAPCEKIIDNNNNSYYSCSGESTITTNKDESAAASTCNTELSLSPFTRSYTQLHDLLNGSGKRMLGAGNQWHQKADDLIPVFAQTANPVRSAKEAVDYDHMSSAAWLRGEKIRLPFIDFLGVGAT